jgi:hypothetical protein
MQGKWSCRPESQLYILTLDEVEEKQHEKEKQDKNQWFI